MTNLITAQDLADFAPDLDTSAYTSTTISGIISQATAEITQFCSVKDFVFGTYTDKDRARITNKGELVINPRVRPVVSVQSVRLKRGGFSTNLTLTDSAGNPLYDIPDPGDRIHIPNSYLYLTGTYLAGGNSQMMTLQAAQLWAEVSYTAGWQTIPQDLKDICILWVQDIVMRKINRAGAQSFTQGSLSINFGKSNRNGDSPMLMQAKYMLNQGGYNKVGMW